MKADVAGDCHCKDSRRAPKPQPCSDSASQRSSALQLAEHLSKISQRKPRDYHQQECSGAVSHYLLENQDVYANVMPMLRASQSLITGVLYELETVAPRSARAWCSVPSPGNALLEANSLSLEKDHLGRQGADKQFSGDACSTLRNDIVQERSDSYEIGDSRQESRESENVQSETAGLSPKSAKHSSASEPSSLESHGMNSMAQSTNFKRSASFGKFAQAFNNETSGGDLKMSSARQVVAYILEHAVTQLVSVSLILLTVVLICMDANARASGSETAFWEELLLTICSLAYLMEFSAFVYVQQLQALFDKWFYVDAMVIIASAIGYIVSALDDAEGLQLIKLLRLFRLLRLGRLVRALKLMQKIKWLKEPYILSLMMASCLRTLIWAFLLMFFVITLWSVLAVELLHEVVQELGTSLPEWQSCDRCSRAFSSVWDANLTFLQTTVAGDSWGLVALPVIKQKWWSIIIFVGALSSVVFGVLNMIAAVVIDTFADRRSKDVSSIASQLEYEEAYERRRLAALFAQIDEDQSGALSKEELHTGARRIREFRQYLRVLDIDDKDLSELFDMLDLDNSGEIDPEEFIDALYRMKSTESKTALRFVKHMVSNLFDKHKCMDDRIDLLQQKVSKRLSKFEATFESRLEAAHSQDKIQEFLESHAIELDKTVGNAIDNAVTLAFDAVLGTAACQASQAIRQVIASTSKHAAQIADRARGSDLSSLSSMSRQTSRLSELFSPHRGTKIARLPSSLSGDTNDERKTSDSRMCNQRRLVHLGETMMDVDPVIDQSAIVSGSANV